jgi:hypothetical protein
MTTNDNRPVTFYWPSVCCIMDDRTVAIRATGYDEEGAHWTGERRWSSDSPDYGFWRWIFEHKERWGNRGFFSDTDLATLRAEYEANAV